MNQGQKTYQRIIVRRKVKDQRASQLMERLRKAQGGVTVAPVQSRADQKCSPAKTVFFTRHAKAPL